MNILVKSGLGVCLGGLSMLLSTNANAFTAPCPSGYTCTNPLTVNFTVLDYKSGTGAGMGWGGGSAPSGQAFGLPIWSACQNTAAVCQKSGYANPNNFKVTVSQSVNSEGSASETVKYGSLTCAKGATSSSSLGPGGQYLVVYQLWNGTTGEYPTSCTFRVFQAQDSNGYYIP